jgi:hypothetical protein
MASATAAIMMRLVIWAMSVARSVVIIFMLTRAFIAFTAPIKVTILAFGTRTMLTSNGLFLLYFRAIATTESSKGQYHKNCF